MPEGERRTRLGELVAEETTRPFDLAVSPLVRMTLVQEARGRFLLLVNSHQIVFDDLSGTVLLRELSVHYSRLAAGEKGAVAPLPMQYADYATWEREWNEGAVAEAQLAFWRKELSGAPALLELPTDHPRPAFQSFRGGTESARLKEGLLGRLRILAGQLEVSPTALALAAFQTLLVRYSRQNDISVSVPVPGRGHACLKNLIGYFSNTLVIRTDVSEDPAVSFRTFLGRVCRGMAGAYAHQDLPFERVVEAIKPERNVSHGPLSQVLFSWDEGEAERCECGEVSMRMEPLHAGSTRYDIALHLEVAGEGLVARAEYATELFDRSTIGRMLQNFETLLEGILADPDASILQLPLMTPEEMRRVLVEWNQTDAAYPRDACFHQLFEQQAAKTPDAVAVRRAGAAISYRELNGRANQLAGHLQGLGVGPDVLVGVCMSRSLDMMVALLGVMKAGGAYVPLDPTYPPERLRYMLQDAKAPVLLTERALVQGIPPLAAAVLCVDSEWDVVARQSAENAVSAATPDHLAYVIYTSGSTGRPKGAMIPHRGLVNYLTWAVGAYPVAGGRGAPVHSSISFDLTITGLFAPLLVGKTVELIPEEREIEGLTETLQAETDFSLVKITPAHLEILARQIPAAKAAHRTRSFIIGGENLTADHVAFWQKYAPATALVNEYGPTETVVGCCIYVVPAGEVRPGSIPIGRPIANTRLYVLDTYMRPVPIGVPGELYIGGAGVGRGYLGQPELTAKKFVADPFSAVPGATLYRSGDLVRYRGDGNLEFLGRMDHQVKIRGFRIELGEIESAFKLHPGICDSAVIAREDMPGDKRLVAYFTAAEGAAPSTVELRDFLKERLPAYMVPSAFVVLAELPLTVNGKLNRAMLPPPEAANAPAEHFVAPRSEVERKIAALWEKLLQIPQIGIHDNFFDLGGHSLLAVRLVTDLNRAFDLSLRVLTIFQHPTIAKLAAIVAKEGTAGGKRPSVVSFREGLKKPPVFLIFAGPDEFRIAQMLPSGHAAMGVEIAWPVSWRNGAEGGDEAAFPTVEEIAMPFADAIASHPNAPGCILLGYSFAGILAFETAHLLNARGFPVKKLVVVDSWRRFPTHDELPLPLRMQIGMRNNIERVTSRYQWGKRWFSSLSRAKRREELELSASAETARSDEMGVSIPSEIVYRIYDHARKKYRPVPLRAEGVLLQARDAYDRLLLQADPEQGWGGLFDHGLKVVSLPGNHLTIVRDREKSRALAKHLHEALG